MLNQTQFRESREVFVSKSHFRNAKYLKSHSVLINNKYVHLSSYGRSNNEGSVYDIEEIERVRQSLIDSNFKHACLYDCVPPFELLDAMKNEGLTFDSRIGCTISKIENGYNLLGNFNELSSVFSYRFFCKRSLDSWIEKASILDPKFKGEIIDGKLIP
jgi:hypothetical protein